MRQAVLYITIVVGLAGGASLLSACGDDAQVVAKQVRDFIQNVGTPDGAATSALIQGAPPEPSGGPDADVEIGTATVLTGGGVSATVSADVPFGRILLYVDGAEDYFRIDLPAPTGTAEVVVALSQDVPDSSFSFEYAVVDTNGAVGNFIGTEVAVEDVPAAKVQISVSWSTAADVNLQVTDPSEAVINNESPNSASGGSLNQDANAGCARSATTAETITWSGEPPEGYYHVAVTLGDDCGVENTTFVLVVNREGYDPIVEVIENGLLSDGTPWPTSVEYLPSLFEDDPGSGQGCDLSGSWSGTWYESMNAVGGQLLATLQQDASTLTGTGSVTVTDCPTGQEEACSAIETRDAAMSGFFDGVNVTIQADTLGFVGTVSESCDQMGGEISEGEVNLVWGMDRISP